MMITKYEKELSDNKFLVRFTTTFTDQEQELADKYGEPSVNFGGSITGPPAFEMADHYRLMKSGLPYAYTIDGNGDDDAEDKMNAWAAEIRGRLLSAISTLRSKIDDFSGEHLETL